MRSIPFYAAILSLIILQVGMCDDPKPGARINEDHFESCGRVMRYFA